MSLYITSLMADEHRKELIREATAYRAFRQARTARRASSARRKASTAMASSPAEPSLASAAVYCSRAAAFNARSGSRHGAARLGGAA